MSQVENEVLAAAQAIAPTAPVVEVAVDVAATIADASPANVLADLELAYSLVKQFKGLHLSIQNLIKVLLHG